MWIYQDITREELDKAKDSVEAIMLKLGATIVPVVIESNDTTLHEDSIEMYVSKRRVFRFDESFYRVDEVLFPGKPFLVIECADTYMEVKENQMEDSDPFPYDLSYEEMLDEVKFILEY